MIASHGCVIAWIALLFGARTLSAIAPPAGPDQTPVESDKGTNQHWAFQPIRRPSVPEVQGKRWALTPVDNFILAKLEQNGIAPTPPADKYTLLRRVTFDLTGLPPTPDEVEAFIRDKSPGALGRVVDRLLDSPRYGECWGRHWLDVVRYADTAGDSADYPVPQARLYRDYVIGSFNKDKPYDQFLREQIAGDLLPAEGEAERRERLIATGFIAISRRFSTTPEAVHHLTIEDTLDTMGRAVLGLSMSCARCHDHKFDPISMQDYYALYGIFSSTRYPYPGSETTQHQKDFVLMTPRAEAEVMMKPFTNQLALLTAEVTRLEKERDEARKLIQLSLAQGYTLEASEEPPPGKRRLTDITPDLDEAKKKRDEFAAHPPPVEWAYAVADGTPADAKIQKRGEPLTPGQEVPRGFLMVLGGQKLPPQEKGSGRLELAGWLTDPRNPLTARVMVNRIWQHHFGKGLVATPSDFGTRGQPPTHPELLDYLAQRFIESGWSIKTLHRLMVLSAAYQQSSGTDDLRITMDELNSAADGRRVNRKSRIENPDPDNHLCWRHDRRRLEAEEIRDAMLAVSGELDLTPGSPHPFPPESSWDFTQHAQFTAIYDSNQRSVYLMQQRIKKHPFLALFDGADANASTGERAASTTPLQALFMMNDPFLHAQAEKFATRLLNQRTGEIERIIRACELAMGRPPSRREIWNAENYLRQVGDRLKASQVPVDEVEKRTWESFARVLFGNNEFIFVD